MRDSKDDFHCPLCGCRLFWFPVSHIFLCESCEQSFNEKAEAYLRHQTKSPVGNAAAMREALETIHDKVNGLDEECGVDPVEIRDLARAALAMPIRNCDVGTAEEQAERFFALCNSNKCPSCPCRFTKKTDCALIWAQMPYEAEEGGAK